ncbi:hypothetical protein J9332_25900, partial [Aquimarina celericrescens]|nr:hypothetical protein [Aquimarina celericrescens]
EYFNTIDKNEALRAIIILLYIFNDAEFYSFNSTSVWNMLSEFIVRQLKFKIGNNDFWTDNDKPNIWKYIVSEFIDKDNFKLKSKIQFLALISESRIRLDFSDWGTTEDDLKDLSLSLYKKLLDDKQNNLWDIHDYSFYHAYHDVRKFHTADKINLITIDFWSKNDITLLCAQMIQNDAWTTKMLKTSDYAAQLFGSKQKYKEFINNNLPNPITSELKEYVQFLELESYTDFSRYIRFEFSSFNFIKLKLQRVIDFNNLAQDEAETIVEIVLKSDNKDLWNITYTDMNTNVISGFIELRRYNIGGTLFTFIRLQSGNYHKSIPEMFQHYKEMLSNNNINSKIDLEQKSITVEDIDESIKIISVQPTSYDSKIKST